VLFDIDGVASGIISAKFLRKKETEDMVYFSIPEDYEINCSVRELVNMKWVAVKQYKLTANELKPLVLEYNKIK
jgi:hypothetical protein